MLIQKYLRNKYEFKQYDIFNIYMKLSTPKRRAQLKGVQFGARCQVSKSIDFGSEPYLIKIGSDFYASENIQFITHDGSVNVLRNLYKEWQIYYFKPIIIKNNVFIGYNVTILPGTVIEENTIVGANSLVKGTLKVNSVYAGNLIKLICSLEEYRNKNKNNILFTKHLNAKEKEKILKKWLKDNYSDF